MNIPTIHRDSLVIDGHCDSVLNYDKDIIYDFNSDNFGVHLDYEKMKKGSIDLQFMAIFIEDLFLPHSAFSNCVRLLEKFKTNIESNSEFELITNKQDLNKLYQNETNKKFGLMTVEGGEVIEGHIELLRALYYLGVRSMTLTWNRRNQLADGCGLGDRACGLTDFGVNVIHEMDKLGMVVDVSHLSINGFYEVIRQTDNPVVATHSNAISLTDHPRNLNDDQIKAIAETDGVIGLNFAPHFLKTSYNTTGLQDVYTHLEHIIKLVGENHVALGSDFDGVESLPEGVASAEDVPKLTEFLQRQGMSDRTLEKLLGLNWLRVLKEVLPEK